jgi:hypothetical protein
VDGGRCPRFKEPCQEENARQKNRKIAEENGRGYEAESVFTWCFVRLSGVKFRSSDSAAKFVGRVASGDKVALCGPRLWADPLTRYRHAHLLNRYPPV